MALRTRNGWRLFAWGGEGFADRLNSVYTVVILLAAALVVTAMPFLHMPIACWAPAHFTGAAYIYTNEVCWKAKEYLPITDPNSLRRDVRTDAVKLDAKHHYLALLFLGQALLFLIPCFLWQGLQVLCGVCLQDVTRAAQGTFSTDPVVRDWSLRYLIKRAYHRTQGMNHTLEICYIIVKAIYCLNSMLQLVFINNFIGGSGFIGYGFSILVKALGYEDGSHEYDTPRYTTNNYTEISYYPHTPFPSQVGCDFEITRLGNIQKYTVTCQMVLSEFYEMVYAATWLWLLFVCLTTFLSAVGWFLWAILPPLRDIYVSGKLVAMDKITVGLHQTSTSRQFAQNFLSGDAYFLIRHIASEVSDVTAAKVVAGLWDEFLNNQTTQLAQAYRPGFSLAPIASSTMQQENIPLEAAQTEGFDPKLA